MNYAVVQYTGHTFKLLVLVAVTLTMGLVPALTFGDFQKNVLFTLMLATNLPWPAGQK